MKKLANGSYNPFEGNHDKYGLCQHKSGAVYVCQHKNIFKIGATRSTKGNVWGVKNRIQSISRQTGLNFEFIMAIETNCAFGLESFLKETFRDTWLTRELFLLGRREIEFTKNITRFNGGNCGRFRIDRRGPGE